MLGKAPQSVPDFRSTVSTTGEGILSGKGFSMSRLTPQNQNLLWDIIKIFKQKAETRVDQRVPSFTAIMAPSIFARHSTEPKKPLQTHIVIKTPSKATFPSMHTAGWACD